MSKKHLSNLNRGFTTRKQHFKENKKSISTFWPCTLFHNPYRHVHIVEHIIHVETLIKNGAMAYFVDENFTRQEYF